MIVPCTHFYSFACSGTLRYEYEHQIAPDEDGMYRFKHLQFPQERRISLMLRDVKK
jgi:hypothetical protein